MEIYSNSKFDEWFDGKENINFKENDIFFIGAGGLKSRDLKPFLKNGYNALAIGRELSNQIPDQDLEIWLKDFHTNDYK